MLHSATWVGPAVLSIFFAGYALVFAEDAIRLRKSKPVMIAGGLVWVLVAIAFKQEGRAPEVAEDLRKVLIQFAEMFLFLVSAMNFVNAMAERNVFEYLRVRMMRAKLSMRGIFWMTGAAAFVLSPIADNLTTALVMGTVVLSSMSSNRKAAVGALINVVVAANAGGAFSPFGDITTLMVWQKGVVEFGQFFHLFIPSLVNWLVPAFLISLTIPNKRPEATVDPVRIRKGGLVIVGMFLGTIAATVMMDHTLGLPPFLGMMLGLGVLNVFGYYLNGAETRIMTTALRSADAKPFNIFDVFKKVEWDTLLFFYGIMLCIGGLEAVGYLDGISHVLYEGLGSTTANISIGILSAIVDNIPLTFAVLTMNPDMNTGEWLLITLTAGVGGSLLSIGSAAGVALMGVGRGVYTFMAHLKWTWAIFLGYAASIVAHFLLNASFFE